MVIAKNNKLYSALYEDDRNFQLLCSAVVEFNKRMYSLKDIMMAVKLFPNKIVVNDKVQIEFNLLLQDLGIES